MIPADDAVVLDRLPEADDPGRRALHALHARLHAHPDDLALAVQVARAEMTECRTLFDPRACGRAESALGPWIGSASPPVEVLLLRGVLRQTSHLFDQAIDDLGRVLEKEPLNAQALLTRAVVREVRGEYDMARRDCAEAAYRVREAAQVACLAGATSLTGHAAVTLAALKAADADGTPDERLWALTLEGEIAGRLGRGAEAEDAFRRARDIGPNDSYLLGAYADLLRDQGRDRDAAEMLAGRTQIDPLLLRLAEAEERLGKPDPAHVSALARSFETSRRRGDVVHQREQARFELHVLHQPQAALVTAESNWQVQREPADARILMEAALAAGQPQAAAPALAWFRDNTVEDAPVASLAAQLGAAP